MKAVLGDKGYDSTAFVERIAELEAEAVIPSRKGRKEPREHDGGVVQGAEQGGAVLQSD